MAQRNLPPASGNNENLGQEEGHRNEGLINAGDKATATVNPQRELLEEYRQHRKLEKERLAAEKSRLSSSPDTRLSWLRNLRCPARQYTC